MFHDVHKAGDDPGKKIARCCGPGVPGARLVISVDAQKLSHYVSYPTHRTAYRRHVIRDVDVQQRLT
ncbi:hypothetical protein Q8F57_044075 [Paraburkholderia terrae]|uniref:hypothetical protein n=1 Tax=Paraburkholderia terrae TaxID=311230 RepID=UPI00296B1EA0|nr:hypothetical protein [Paraburkholderia terrae]